MERITQDFFDYIEEAVNRDKHLGDILSITMMEILGMIQQF